MPFSRMMSLNEFFLLDIYLVVTRLIAYQRGKPIQFLLHFSKKMTLKPKNPILEYDSVEKRDFCIFDA